MIITTANYYDYRCKAEDLPSVGTVKYGVCFEVLLHSTDEWGIRNAIASGKTIPEIAKGMVADISEDAAKNPIIIEIAEEAVRRIARK